MHESKYGTLPYRRKLYENANRRKQNEKFKLERFNQKKVRVLSTKHDRLPSRYVVTKPTQQLAVTLQSNETRTKFAVTLRSNDPADSFAVTLRGNETRTTVCRHFTE